MKTISCLICFIYLFSTDAAHSQVILTDTTNDIFRNRYEFSGLTVSNNKFYLLSEKCKKIFVGFNNYYSDGFDLNFSSSSFQNVELEGFCFYQNPILFACDERNAKVIVIDIAHNTATEVPTDADLSAWTGNTGFEGIAIDKERNKLFLLREKDGQGHSDIRIFDIIKKDSNFSLKSSETISIDHRNQRWRYSDIAYNESKQQLLLIRSLFEGECSNANKYTIDTIKIARILTGPKGRSKRYLLNSESLTYKDVSSTINSYCKNYSTNIEGISLDNDFIYLVSDNKQTDAPKCNEKSEKAALFIKFPIRHNVNSSTSLLINPINKTADIPLIDCAGSGTSIKQKFSSKDSSKAWERVVVLPTQGRFVEEAHYLTNKDSFPNKYPKDSIEGIMDHLNRSFALYNKFDSSAKFKRLFRFRHRKEWTPSENREIGQGAIGDLQLTRLNPEDELWMMNMMWDKGQRPKIGTKFLVSANNKNVVVVAGYETGPQAKAFLGGVTGEVHEWLGTGNNSRNITVSLLKDQGVASGPCRCKE